MVNSLLNGYGPKGEKGKSLVSEVDLLTDYWNVPSPHGKVS